MFKAYNVGICCASVCTNLTDSETTKILNIDYPTGIKSQWAISKDKTFSGGEPNPCPCPDNNDARHILFNC